MALLSIRDRSSKNRQSGAVHEYTAVQEPKPEPVQPTDQGKEIISRSGGLQKWLLNIPVSERRNSIPKVIKAAFSDETLTKEEAGAIVRDTLVFLEFCRDEHNLMMVGMEIRDAFVARFASKDEYLERVTAPFVEKIERNRPDAGLLQRLTDFGTEHMWSMKADVNEVVTAAGLDSVAVNLDVYTFNEVYGMVRNKIRERARSPEVAEADDKMHYDMRSGPKTISTITEAIEANDASLSGQLQRDTIRAGEALVRIEDRIPRMISIVAAALKPLEKAKTLTVAEGAFLKALQAIREMCVQTGIDPGELRGIIKAYLPKSFRNKRVLNNIVEVLRDRSPFALYRLAVLSKQYFSVPIPPRR